MTPNIDRNQVLFDRAKALIPGGVNSPVRAFKSVGGGPIVFDKVKDAYCFDVDGNKRRQLRKEGKLDPL